MDKTNRDKELSGRFESEKNLPQTRPYTDQEKKMIKEWEKKNKNVKNARV